MFALQIRLLIVYSATDQICPCAGFRLRFNRLAAGAFLSHQSYPRVIAHGTIIRNRTGLPSYHTSTNEQESNLLTGADSRDRTGGLRVTNPSLCHLSYISTFEIAVTQPEGHPSGNIFTRQTFFHRILKNVICLSIIR